MQQRMDSDFRSKYITPVKQINSSQNQHIQSPLMTRPVPQFLGQLGQLLSQGHRGQTLSQR